MFVKLAKINLCPTGNLDAIFFKYSKIISNIAVGNPCEKAIPLCTSGDVVTLGMDAVCLWSSTVVHVLIAMVHFGDMCRDP
jgi:hypothetical protein